ncbi:SCAN domain-containing protein 3 [Eumeta japonica]|uniref:SCAN domain-containing protein 3 n=1 Tax=Eumeta variegata TaxID=151549 RepID=A0A4C1T6M3_EUMVA|nr:SCAN domain-containing protein 3 [Eumeta japonica]
MTMKPSKLEDHLRRCHPDKIGKDLKYFQTLKEKYEKRPTMHSMFSSTSESNDDGLRASYNISLLIAKSGKRHTIGEQLILPAVEEVLKTAVLHKSSFDILKRIPLSNNINKQRHIDEMSCNVESFLCDYLQTTNFSIQLEESTLPGNEALLLAFVRFVMGEEIHEELLFAKTLTTDTKVISVATDGVAAMVGRYRGLISHLKALYQRVTRARRTASADWWITPGTAGMRPRDLFTTSRDYRESVGCNARNFAALNLLRSGGARRRRPPTASRLKGPRKQKSLLLKRGLAKGFAYKLLKRGLANLMSPTSTSGVAPPLWLRIIYCTVHNATRRLSEPAPGRGSARERPQAAPWFQHRVTIPHA